jgi:hypothetical protein
MSFANTSILINRQVPEFVREEHPLFITFLEAYYEYLEQKQTGQLNDLTQKAKDLRYLSDVDYSLNEFEDSFFNTYASLLPKDVAVDKEFLIKNVLPLYLAKGNEASFKLLFRMLFNDEVDILQPRNNVLRASDGKWTVDNILRIETDIRSIYTGDGSNSTFPLAQTFVAGPERRGLGSGRESLSLPGRNRVDVYVNGVIKTEGTDYYIRRESNKVIFITPPAANSSVKIFYDNFDITEITNRKITGSTSGATALVERASQRIITDRLNFGLPFELFINTKTLIGEFQNGETITTDIIDSNDNVIQLEADTFSILTQINVINGGSSYNVGDPVTVLGGGATTSATAEVEVVSEGFTDRIVVNYGGAGFKLASGITSSNTPGTTLLIGAVDEVNTSHFTANSYVVIGTDQIFNFNGSSNAADTLISAANYGFPAAPVENVNTRIIDALTSLTVTDLGPITNAVILFSNVSVNTAILDSQGALYPVGNTFNDIKDFNSVGRIDVYGGGASYKIGDEIIFGANPSGTIGTGAAAAVKTVNATGAITTIQIQPPRITGTANVLNNTVEIIGTNTFFNNDLQVGDKIVLRSQERFINAVTSNTTANVNVAFTFESGGGNWANNYPIGSFAHGLVGGINYTQNNTPTVTVSTGSGGSGANIAITSLIGNGEQLQAIADQIAGQIQRIRLITGGVGYQYIPEIDLTNFGNGNADAEAVLGASYAALPGRWITSDSILSNPERRLQGSDYYVDYAYVTSSLTEFSKYKQILKGLLHPSGFVNYADLNKQAEANVTISVDETTSNTISGLVNVFTGTIFVTGTGTRFNIANTNGIITIGSNVAVNGQIRTISSIVSNTNLAVSSAFTTTANDQTLIILT